jgi:hypothetical protein
MIVFYENSEIISERIITGLVGDVFDIGYAFTQLPAGVRAMFGTAETNKKETDKVISKIKKYLIDNSDFTGPANNTGMLSLRQQFGTWRACFVLDDMKYKELLYSIKTKTLKSTFFKFDWKGRKIKGLDDAYTVKQIRKIIDTFESRVNTLFNELSKTYDVKNDTVGVAPNVMSLCYYGSYDLFEAVKRHIRYGGGSV